MVGAANVSASAMAAAAVIAGNERPSGKYRT
jgi:hypothetical protein